MTPAGIKPATFGFVAQHLNHCATAVHGALKGQPVMKFQAQNFQSFSITVSFRDETQAYEVGYIIRTNVISSRISCLCIETLS